MKKLRKAVLPVAGFGTRFLPATKATPKEMLPIIDKPLVQYAVEEAIKIGIEEIIFITNPSKYSIKNHFDKSLLLEEKLIKSGKFDFVEKLNPSEFNDIKFTYINQQEQKGLGHAILLAEDFINNEPFAVLLPDDLFFSEKSCLMQLEEVYRQTNSSVIAVNKIDAHNIHKYGVIKPGFVNNRAIEVLDIVEKPKYEDAPSDIAVCGRYILNSSIFKYLNKTSPDSGEEIQLTDAIKMMLKDESVYACVYQGEKFDCGSKKGFVEATLTISLRDPEIKDEIKDFIRKQLN
jgi:UTP--glucose-1-phosphate uridylyltransferase|tara:strand:+ start:169 stop:1038 length:870 start_codon:yes stop_codon:yes gene_type:complete